MELNSKFNILVLYWKLFLTCCMYTTCYPILYFTLENLSSFKYLKMNKKLYVIKNIIKAISLCYLSIVSYQVVYELFTYGNLDMVQMRNWGCIFVGNDITALFMIPKLPRNTRNHHMMTGFLLNFVFWLDGNEMEFLKLIAIYTIFSYYSFLVNLYLGVRYLELLEKEDEENRYIKRWNQTIDNLRIVAYYIYGISLSVNWLFHFYYAIFLIKSWGWSHLMYVIFLTPIIQDDLILLSWLKYKKNLV